MFTFVITMGEETFSEQLVCQDACLGKTPHCLTHFKIYKSVLCKLVQIVLLPSPGWEEGERHFHVFVLIKGSGQVEIFDVEAHVLCTFGA
jgi:hypothetical protein